MSPCGCVRDCVTVYVSACVSACVSVSVCSLVAAMSVDLTPEPMLVDPHDNTKYTILERIGEGTFSVVYRAKRKVTAATKSTCNLRGVDPNIVALKCIHPNSSPSRILNVYVRFYCIERRKTKPNVSGHMPITQCARF